VAQNLVGDGLPGFASGALPVCEQVPCGVARPDRPEFNDGGEGKFRARVKGSAQLFGTAGDDQSASDRFGVQPFKGLTTQGFWHLIQAVQKECNAGSVKELIDCVWPKVWCPQVLVVTANRPGHPVA
jgi:hypothetical protein